MAYSVTQRTHEIGVRVALGARRSDVLRLVVGGALKMATIGLSIGLVLALLLTRALSSALFGVMQIDIVTFAVLTSGAVVGGGAGGLHPRALGDECRSHGGAAVRVNRTNLRQGNQMIQLKNIERSYKTAAGQTWVLRRVNLEIRQGEFVTFMGPSGAGKSSLLNVLALLDDQWLGEYWFREQAVHDMKRKQRGELAKRNIGMVFQSYHLLDDLTVRENIDLPLSYKDVPSGQRQSLVADTLDRFQIVAKKDLFPSQLSGGQQQLVGVARAVIHKPALLLADEPTGNLHSSQAKEIMELFRELNQQGTTIVQVTHSEANAAYGSRTIQLRDGWMVGDTANPDLQPYEAVKQ